MRRLLNDLILRLRALGNQRPPSSPTALIGPGIRDLELGRGSPISDVFVRVTWLGAATDGFGSLFALGSCNPPRDFSFSEAKGTFLCICERLHTCYAMRPVEFEDSQYFPDHRHDWAESRKWRARTQRFYCTKRSKPVYQRFRLSTNSRRWTLASDNYKITEI
jgi:hypothetical protein